VVRVAVYVDGFNLYFGLKAKHGRKYLWLDLQALAASLLRPGQTLERTTYFTARVRNDPEGQRRQSDYLDALASHSPLVTVVDGRFQEKPRRCRDCTGVLRSRLDLLTNSRATGCRLAMLCSRTGDLGRQALAGQEQEGGLVGTGCLRLRVRGPISAAYLTYYLGHPAVRDWVNRNATGSAILSLNTKTLGLMPVILPPLAVQSVAAEVLGALDEKIAVYDEISRTTAALRDSLLPLLLVGPVGTALL
jgi:hypothetical protein